MSFTEINKKLDELGNAWHEFKNTNEENIKLIKKGNTDSLIEKKMDKLNDYMNHCQDKIQNIESSINRDDYLIIDNNSSNTIESKNFENYLRTGNYSPDNTKSISERSSDSGYIMPNYASKLITNEINNSSVIRNIANVTYISSNELDFIRVTTPETARWDNYTAVTTSDIALDQQKISIHNLSAQPQITQTLLDDFRGNLSEWVVDQTAQNFAKEEEDSFLNGNNPMQPKGILHATNINSIDYDEALNATTNGVLSSISDGLIALIYSLPEKFSYNNHIVTSRTFLTDIRTAKDSNDRYLWQPKNQIDSFDTFCGIPILTSSAFPTTTTKAIIGDFKNGYQVVDRSDITVLRDPYTTKPFVTFYITKRVGGDLIDNTAFSKLVDVG